MIKDRRDTDMEMVTEKQAVSKSLTTKDLVYTALFTTLIAICAWISIPTTIPFTMQTMGVFVAVGILGMKRGTLSVLMYILLGAIGVPVFAGFSGGMGVVFGTTGGYLIGYLVAALLSGGMIKLFGKSIPVMAVAMVVGLVACYAFGTAWFMYLYARNTGAVALGTALSWCVFPYVIPDLIKIGLAILLVKRVGKYVAL